MASCALSPADRTLAATPEGAAAFSLRVTRAAMLDTKAWDTLALRASDPNPFAESWYLGTAIEALGAAGRVSLLCLYRGEELCGLLPVVRRGLYYRYPLPHLAGWLHGNAFLGSPLVAAGCEAPFWRALLSWADDAAGLALFLHLRDMPMDTDLTRALETVAAEQGRTCSVVHRHERALLQGGASPEAHWSRALNGKKRKELRRQAKRLGEEGELTFVRQHNTGGLGEWIDSFLSLEARGWKGESGNAMAREKDTHALFVGALHGAAERGRLERLALRLDGRPIAMLANFTTPPGAFAFKTAFDERYARFSPGVLLQQENLALMQREGIDWCDSCAAEDHPMIDRLWPDRRAIGRYSIAIGGPRRHALFDRLLTAETHRP